MAKRKKSRKARKSARSVARKVIAKAVRKSRPKKRRKSKSKSKPRRIGAKSRKPMKKSRSLAKRAMRSAVGGVVVGGTTYVTGRLLDMVPEGKVSPWIVDIGAYAVGVGVGMALEPVGVGIAAKATERIIDRAVAMIGNGGTRVAGKRVRDLKASDVRAIREAAMSDRMGATRERTVVGRDGAVGAGFRDIV